MLDLILIIVVLLLIFGGSKLREAGSDLGAVVKSVRRTFRGAGSRPPVASGTAPDAAADAEFPEVLAARRQAAGRRADRE